MKNIFINDREIGTGVSPYVIAEMSANHNGDINKALETITRAKMCGADAVKMQSYTADTMTIDCDSSEFTINGGLWDGYKLYDLYKWAETPFEWHKELFDHAKSLGITLFSTPFDESAVDLLEDLDTPAYKIASFEAIDLPLVEYVASTQKPVIVSTGMANLLEIEEVIDTVRSTGNEDLIVLHCISSYPAPPEQSNLLTIPDMRRRFGVHIGLSDHTISSTASISSVSLGAVAIEKHFILDRNDEGPDSKFSIEPIELERLCNEVKTSYLSLGVAGYDRKPSEMESAKYRRSIYFVEDLKSGDLISRSSIRRIRPGYGLPPKHFESLIGRKVNSDIERGMPVSWSLIDDE